MTCHEREEVIDCFVIHFISCHPDWTEFQVRSAVQLLMDSPGYTFTGRCDDYTAVIRLLRRGVAS